MQFIPEITPPPGATKAAFWFLFQGDRLLLQMEQDKAEIPFAPDLRSWGLEPLRQQYLGRLDGYPCYSGELSTGSHVPPGMALHGLRRVYGLLGEDMFVLTGRALQIAAWDRTHQYCGQCGSSTITKSDERAKVCPKCGLINFPRISPAVIVAIVKDDRILLARGTRFPTEMYSVIAGFVEAGETFEACVRREVKEEVGIDVKNITYFGSQPWPFPNSLMVGFTAEYAGGDITVDKTEIAAADWYRLDEFPPIPDKISIARRLIDWFASRYPSN